MPGKLRSSLTLVVLTALLVPVSTAAAAPSPTPAPAGISLAPFEQQVTILPTDDVKSFDVVLTNHTASLQELGLSVRDFGSLNDTGGILLEGSNNYTQKYGLASWLSLGTDTVVLQPNESRSVLVSVLNRSDLQPGGHYGAVVAAVNSLNDQTGNHVVINQQLLSLVLVNKSGGEHYDLKLAGISQNGNWLQLPNVVKLHFQNPGNVHVIPRGTVKLIGPDGGTVAQGIINDDSSFVLPETFRDIYVPLIPTGSGGLWPGVYRVEADYRYDGISRYAVKHYLVHYIDLKLYLLAGLLIGLGWYLYRRRWWRAKITAKKPAKKSD